MKFNGNGTVESRVKSSLIKLFTADAEKARGAKGDTIMRMLTTDELRLLLTLKGRRLETVSNDDPAKQLLILINYTTERDDYSITQFETELNKLRTTILDGNTRDR